VAQAGGELVGCVTVGDDRLVTTAAVSAALADANLVITSGGVSVGDHDHVRSALAELGVEELFWGVRIRPGHPTWFGRRGDVRVLALPGNPVAGVVCFWVFGRPLMGCDDPWVRHRIGADYPVATPRTDLIRCVDGPDGLVPSDLQASHHISGLAAASHLAVIEEGRGGLRKGDPVVAVSLAG
jgi:molybdopterin molybdotransferase